MIKSSATMGCADFSPSEYSRPLYQDLYSFYAYYSQSYTQAHVVKPTNQICKNQRKFRHVFLIWGILFT